VNYDYHVVASLREAIPCLRGDCSPALQHALRAGSAAQVSQHALATM
jgi:hypothetical protein